MQWNLQKCSHTVGAEKFSATFQKHPQLLPSVPGHPAAVGFALRGAGGTSSDPSPGFVIVSGWSGCVCAWWVSYSAGQCCAGSCAEGSAKCRAGFLLGLGRVVESQARGVFSHTGWPCHGVARGRDFPSFSVGPLRSARTHAVNISISRQLKSQGFPSVLQRGSTRAAGAIKRRM